MRVVPHRATAPAGSGSAGSATNLDPISSMGGGLGGAGATDVAGREGDDPAGTVVVPVSGLHVIGYHSKHSSVTLEAPKFEAYLKEEGLERVSALRRERGESGKPGREIFSRCAKALVLGGAGGRGGVAARLPASRQGWPGHIRHCA